MDTVKFQNMFRKHMEHAESAQTPDESENKMTKAFHTAIIAACKKIKTELRGHRTLRQNIVKILTKIKELNIIKKALYSTEEITKETKTHITNLEKQIKELRGKQNKEIKKMENMENKIRTILIKKEGVPNCSRT